MCKLLNFFFNSFYFKISNLHWHNKKKKIAWFSHGTYQWLNALCTLPTLRKQQFTVQASNIQSKASEVLVFAHQGVFYLFLMPSSLSQGTCCIINYYKVMLNRKDYCYRWTIILIMHLVKIFCTVSISPGHSANDTNEVWTQQLLQ